MKLFSQLTLVSIVGGAIALGGCASTAAPPGGTSVFEKQPVKVITEPKGALVQAQEFVTFKGNITFAQCTSPCTFQLDPIKPYWLRATVDGYDAATQKIDAGLEDSGGALTGMLAGMGSPLAPLALAVELARIPSIVAHNKEVMSNPKLPSEVKLTLFPTREWH